MSRQVVYPLTQDVRKLLQLCAELDKDLARLVCAEVRLRMQIDPARETCSEVSVGQTEKGGDEAQAAGEISGINESTVVPPKDGSGNE